MRVFCRYLYEQKLINKNIDYVIGGNRYIVKEKLPSIYTREEVLQIESSVNQSTSVGKRDYAMLLLATRLVLYCIRRIMFLSQSKLLNCNPAISEERNPNRVANRSMA